MHPRTILPSVVFLLLIPLSAVAYDSLHLTLQKADSIFLKENLLLLSQAYNIEATDALIIQSKAYPNPVFSANLNAIDPQHDRYFNIGQDGQKEFMLEQLLILGGKRKSTISIARQNKLMAQTELAELLRNLKLQLHSSFFLLSKYRVILTSYEPQLRILDELIQSYSEQAQKGNLPVKDVIRLKSVHLRITNNRIEIISSYLDEVKKIQVLLHTNAHPFPILNENAFQSFLIIPEFNDLLEQALTNRPDFEIAKQERELATTILRLQRQMVVPDVLLNTGYDQRGGAFNNQLQMGVALPLPLWNRNRGNIKAASYDELKAEIYIDQKREQIQAEVQTGYEGMKVIVRDYIRANQLYTADFNDVFRGVNENFTRRNISILEFVDFFEAYNESLADFQRIKTQLALSAEQLNYATASPLY